MARAPQPQTEQMMGPPNTAQPSASSSSSLPLSISNVRPQRVPGPAHLHLLISSRSSEGLPAIEHQTADGSHEAVSYSELHIRAEALARRILAVLPDFEDAQQLVVPLLLPQCPDLYIAQLAVLKAGGAFCPLNLDAPPERVRFILTDVSAKVVLTSRALRSRIDALESAAAVVVVDCDEDHDGSASRPEALISERETSPDSLAYVMYTSGSTGTPKGVGISHSAATQALLAHDHHIPHFSRFLQFAAPTFDVSVFEIFFPLFRGVTLISCDRADMLNDLPAVLRERRVDACELTPTVAGSLLRSRANAPGLRVLLTIGEMLTEPVIREFGGDADRESLLWAMYGPTEATIHCTIQPACEAHTSPNTIGFPLDTVSAFILEPQEKEEKEEAQGEPRILPMGEVGELAVGGYQTAVGYINRPKQTSRVFVDSPYGRLYRTGDKARMSDDGTIQCFGRIGDGQVKLRGQRIELGEIEQAILRAPGCHGAVAAVIQGIIVGFCEQDSPADDAAAKALQTCQDWLPAFMVPGDIIIMQSFPRLSSGKVDRKQLRSDYEAGRTDDSQEYAEFTDAVDIEIARLARDALGLDLRPSSTLSVAGIDSLNAIKFASRLRAAGYSVDAIDVLNSKSISQLRSRMQLGEAATEDGERKASSVTEEDESPAVVDLISKVAADSGISADAVDAILTCTPTQMSMLAETQQKSEAYCNWIELAVYGAGTPETISTWFQSLAQNNEILRTGFFFTQQQYKQVIWKRLDPRQIRTVKSLSRKYQVAEAGLIKPFSVQILASMPEGHTTVLLQVHHAIYDGWSFDIVLADLNRLASGGLAVKRPPFRLVADYYTSNEFYRRANTARGFWAEYLLGFQSGPMPPLLAKQTRSGQIFSARRTLAVKFAAVHAVSAHVGVSPQALFQASLIWLWKSIFGNDDVVIGNVTSGRTIPVDGIEDVVGPCLTTIPLRCRTNQVVTIREFLESIHSSNRECLSHCTLPLNDIRKVAGITPSQSLFEALFVYQESIQSRSSRHEQPLHVRQVQHEDYLETKLLAEIEPMDEGFQLRMTYHADVFHYGYMQLFMRQFECILAHILKDVDAEVASFADCFSTNLLSTYNPYPKSLKSCPDLATLFEQTAATCSEKPAICFAQAIHDDHTAELNIINYKDLNSLSNRIARFLKSSEASEEFPVAIIMEKSIMLYAAILGILKSGCAYLPLLPSTPSARISTILSQADVRLCITGHNSQEDFLGVRGCRAIDLCSADLDGYEDTNVGTAAKPSRIANIIYTSGSTGTPKGVCVTQLNICSNLDVLSRIYPVHGSARMLQACSQAFDVSVFEILFALTRGMCLCAATNDVLFSDLERSIRVMDVTHLSMTPTVASLIDPSHVPKVNFLVTSGEPMTPEVARAWMGKLYQGYGPSETTNICSVKKMTPENHIRHLGHVFENTTALVLAPGSLHVVPIGCLGELCFGGDQVVDGYLKLSSATKEKFVHHPKFGRVYRSGDMGRMLADGSLLIVGRVDDQIKLRGQRVELGEINNVAASCAEVSTCVTLLLQHDSLPQLSCFYVPRSSSGAGLQLLIADDKVSKESKAIYSTLQTRLPAYMVPSFLVPISTVPMTSSGKVDKAKLRELFHGLSQQELQALALDADIADEAGEWTEEERRIAVVVADVLSCSAQDIRRWTPLTSLGLDSISAIALSKELQNTFLQQVPISTILQNPAIAKLAVSLGRKPSKGNSTENSLDMFSQDFIRHVEQQVEAQGYEVAEVLPCTPLQEAMLASSTSEASYLNIMLFRLHIEIKAMQDFWSSMFRRHSILRTCFFNTSDREYAMAQCVLRSWEPRWMTLDAGLGSIDDSLRAHADTVPAALDQGIPPVSLAVITRDEVQYLSFICHHALYDGVAITRLLEEIELVASGFELAPPPSFKPFLSMSLGSSRCSDDFWMKYLEQIQPRTIPHSSDTRAGYDVLPQHLPISLSEVNSSLRALNISMLSLVQASWSILLHVVLNHDDVCFGNVVSGRSSTVDGISELVAPCFNTLPMRFNFSDGAKRNIDVMKSFQSLNPAILEHQFSPLRRIQALCSTGGARLFDTLILLQQASRPLDQRLWVLERDDGYMGIPLVCEVVPQPGQDLLEVKIHFDRSHVSNAFASFIFDTLSHIFSLCLQTPSSHSITNSSLPTAFQERLRALDLTYPVLNVQDREVSLERPGAWSETEKIIRSVLSRISGVKEGRIGRNTTVFQLGLDSINAVQVSAMLRSVGLADISATDILANPSCAKLASNLNTSRSDEDETIHFDLVGFQSCARELLQQSISNMEAVDTILPCTGLQMGMLTEFLNSSGRDYLNFISFRVDPEITASTLVSAWTSVAQVHAMLRTGFTPLEHEEISFVMLQWRAEHMPTPIQVVHSDSFDLITWKLQAARAIFDDLLNPVWRLLVLVSDTGVNMHLAIHHIIYDAHSLRTVLDDVTVALRGHLQKPQTNISTALCEILDQTQRCKKASRDFWQTQAPVAVVNSFPNMTPLKETCREILVRSQRLSISFSVLEKAVRDAGFTVQAVAQASWSRILSSYLGESSVVFGTILSGRNTEATRDAIFPCINTLPVVAQCSSSNRELLQAMMLYNIELQKHQRTPLPDIQRWLGHPSTKLFDTLLVYQKFGDAKDHHHAWHVIDEQAIVDYPLSIEVEPQDDIVELRATFFSDVLPSRQAEILLRQFDAVFCDLSMNPGGDENMLLETRQDLFAITPAEEPELKSEVQFLHQFVEFSAKKFPEKTALEFVTNFDNDQPVSRRWSYKELDEQGDRVASMLSSHVETGGIIAVCFDKCPEAHFAMLGILKAGCALLALDPGAPPSRKEFILQDSGAAVLLTDKSRSLDLDIELDIPVMVIDENSLRASEATKPKTGRDLVPEDISYCLYTSGTTGTPKGCEITHENAVQAMLAFQKLFEGHWDHDSKWLQFASYHFDVSVLEQYWTWSVGIKLIAAPRDVILEDLAGVISRLQITHIDLTPSLARLLHPDDVPSLCRGVFITGGEQLKQEILDVWGPRRVIHNFYGPTEATIGVTSFPCVPINGRSANIGRQFPNVGSFVLRPGTDAPVMRGAVGELCVSGKLVGKGYLNRPNLTEERFPTLKAFNERVYRTGDLVRVLHDGCFEFLGRADDQVKLRGQRLEIGEINHCIKQGVPEITDVVTMVIRNDKQQKDILVSFVVVASSRKSESLQVLSGDEAPVLSHAVQRVCRASLPGYMVPTYVLPLSFIPLSPNNKAELKELRNLFNNLSPEQLMTPSTVQSTSLGGTGAGICKALSSMFHVATEQMSADTNVFELGLDSISALRLARILKQEGYKNANPTVILQNPTVAALSDALQLTTTATKPPNTFLEAHQAVQACQHRHRSAICRSLGVSPDEIEYIAPCSALQQGMISRARTAEHLGAYFNEFRFELSNDINMARLKAAWETVVEDNSVLRTRFVSTTEGHVQVALKKSPIRWDEVHVQQENCVEPLLAARRSSWVEGNSEEVHLPLEVLIVVHDSKKIMSLHIFHGIYDANSLDLLLEEVARLYQDAPRAGPSPPTFLQALLHGPLKDHSSSKDFWRAHLDEVTTTEFPRFSDASDDKDLCVSRQISFEGIERVRKDLCVTQQSIIQTIWGIVLQRLLRSGVTSGVIVSGRSIDLQNVDETIGPLFNTIPYHHKMIPGQTWSSAIRHCHNFNTAILPFQHVALRDIQKWCSVRKPLFENLFSFQLASSTSRGTSRNLWEDLDSSVTSDYPLAFEATLFPDGQLQLLVVAQKFVASEDVLKGMLNDFESLSMAVAKGPHSVVDSISPEESSLHAEHEMHELTEEGPPLPKIGASFQWTAEAMILRREIASLSDIEESSLTSNMTLLELGLDSIDTIKLSARLRRAGVSLSNSQLIKGQSIENLLSMVQRKQPDKAEVHDSGYSSDDDEASLALSQHIMEHNHDVANVQQILPPSPLQDSMVSEMIHSDFQRYFNHDVLEIGSEVNVKQLQEAWMTVVHSSPILRTVFVEVSSPIFDFAYAQVVLADRLLKFEEVEIHSLDEVSRLMEEARMKAVKGRGRRDLLQFQVARTPESVYIVLSISHALYDGWSLGLLHQDVQAAYHGTYIPRAGYSTYLKSTLRSSADGALAFWSDYMSDALPTLFPVQHSDAKRSVNRADKSLGVSAAALKAFCRRLSVSQQAIAQACWAVLLSAHCKRLDVTFGIVLSGRETEASEAMLFPAMNTVPVRAVLYGSVSEFLQYMQENVTNISQFQHFPLRKIQGLVKGRLGPLFNTLFILQKNNLEINHSTATTAPVMKSVQGSSAVDYPLCVEMETAGDSVIWRAACDNDYLSAYQVHELLQHLEKVLHFFISSPDESILKFSDQGVSVCGLPKFVPSELPTSTEVASIPAADHEVWSPTEHMIRTALADMSGVDIDSISKSHNLYHLGLDSISAIKVSSALRSRGLAVPVRELVQAASIEDMAARILISPPAPSDPTTTEHIEGQVREFLGSSVLDNLLRKAGLDATEIVETLPATAAQTHMLSVWQNTDGKIFYPEFKYVLNDVREALTIKSAWKAYVKESHVLRTIFLATGSDEVPFIQLILRPGSDVGNPFVQLDVQERGEDSWTVRLRIHHALYDGVSLPIVIRRFEEFLRDGRCQNKAGTQELAAWKSILFASLDTTSKSRCKAFWTSYLKGARSGLLPTGASQSATKATRIGFLLQSALANTHGLRTLCAKHGFSVQAAFFAAYAKVLASMLNQKDNGDVVFGVYIANRGADDDMLPFPRLSLVPLRVRVQEDFRLEDAATEVQRDLHRIAALENVGVGLWEIRRWTGVMVDSFVNFLSLPEERIITAGRKIGRDGDSGVNLVEVVSSEIVTQQDDRAESAMTELAQQGWLEANAVREAYPDAVDIEASITGDMRLDVGVFGSSNKLSNRGAEDLVGLIIDSLSV